MNLLRQSILFTLVSVFLASSVVADVNKYEKPDPSKAGNEYSSSQYDEQKFQEMQASGRTTSASSYKDLQERLALSRNQEFVPGVRGDLLISMVDAYGDGWNGSELCIAETNCFTIDDGSSAEATLTLGDGTYVDSDRLLMLLGKMGVRIQTLITNKDTN